MTDETPPEKSEIELVYEPGFGSTGSLKENIMVENPIGVYSFNEKTQSQVQKIVANQGINGNPVEALGIVDLKKQKLTKQVHAALNSAMGALIGQPDYPKTSLPQLIQISPVAITALEGSIIETETGIKLDQDFLVFCRTKGATVPDYIRARNMLIDKANETLQVFEVKDLIPSFPPLEEMQKI